jgi:transcription initiation factor TFIID subunit 7
MSMKLKLNTGKAGSGDGNNPAPPTPASTGSAAGFKLKLNASQPPTPATEQTGPAKKGRQSAAPKGRKASAAVNARKRAANDDTISPNPKRPANGPTRKFSIKLGAAAAASTGGDTPTSGGGLNKLMLKRRSTVPKLRALSAKRPPPPRLPGVGYDSEDSDAEEDPAIQQAFILRMQPGPDCDYLHNAITEGKVGAPVAENPAEVSIRWLDKDFRRAIVKVQGRGYAAVLVDLPCIVETMKSWDRKGWWKVADLCQMLLVLGRCSSDEEAKNYALPREVDKETLQYAHGLTPPMHWVRKRRFRKRLSYKTIANVDEEVERLLKEDELAEQQGGEVKHEYLDRAELERSADPNEDYEDYIEEGMDAVETVENDEPEYEEYYDDEEEGDGAPDLEENLQAMFDEQMDTAPAPSATDLLTETPAALPDQAASFMAVETALHQAEAETPMDTSTPAPDEDETPAGEDSDSSSGSDDDEEDEDSPDVMDEDAMAKAAERNQQLEEIADLEREVENQRTKVKNMTNQLLKQRATAQLATLEEDLRVKRGAFGLDGEGEEDEE